MMKQSTISRARRPGLRGGLFRTAGMALAGAVLALAFVAGGLPVRDAVAQITIESARGSGVHLGEITIPLNKSQMMRSQQTFSRIVIGNPEVADVVPLTDRSAYILGKSAGATSLMVYGPNDRLLAVADLVVGFDAQAVKAKLYELLPDETIEVRTVNGNLLLQGEVSSAVAAEKAVRIAEAYAPDSVDNNLSVGPSQQVLLEVIFAEVEKNFGKALGIGADVGYDNGDFSFNVASATGVATGSGATIANLFSGSIGGALGAFDLLASIEAAEQRGLSKVLAKPNLMVLSGDTASFLAGGEFPIQVTQPGTDNFTIEFKEFGVSLSFTPTVLSDGLISLRVRPEVSELVGNDGSITTSRADTTVELRDGQAFSIAGLYQNRFQDDVEQVPWLGDIPIVGAFLRSTNFRETERELVIIVTPRLVQPAKSVHDLKLPTDIYREPSEADLFMLGKIMGDDADAGAAAVSTGGGGGLSGNSGYILK